LNNFVVIFMGSIALVGMVCIVVDMVTNKNSVSCDDDIFDY